MYNDNNVDVTRFFEEKRTILVKTKQEAIKLTKFLGYFYEVFDKNKNFIGYGIPK
jgi:hypothetical protein